MIFPIDKNFVSINELLFTKGALLEGMPTAQKRLIELKEKTYILGIKKSGSIEPFTTILETTYNQIYNEIVEYQKLTNEILLKKMATFTEDQIVASFLVDWMYHLVRGARLMNVLDLKCHYTKTKSKLNDEVYEMVRIYYTSDSGKKVRSISKNLGNIQQTPKHIAIKILRQLGYTNIVESKDQKCDLNAKLGYELYDIDIKANNRIGLIDTFAFIYLWQLYQKAK